MFFLSHYLKQKRVISLVLCHTFKIIVFLLILGPTTDTKAPSAPAASLGGHTQQKRSILIGKRPGLGVSSMLSQFKNYSQTKRNPVLSQRPSVFSSPDDDDEEGDNDYSKFLAIKGNSWPLLFIVSLENPLARTFQYIIH